MAFPMSYRIPVIAKRPRTRNAMDISEPKKFNTTTLANAIVRAVCNLHTHKSGVTYFTKLYRELDDEVKLFNVSEMVIKTELALVEIYTGAKIITHQGPAAIDTAPASV